MANTMTNEELAAKVVDTFLPASVDTLRVLAGNAALVANRHRALAMELRGGPGSAVEWEAVERYGAIRNRLLELIASERLADY